MKRIFSSLAAGTVLLSVAAPALAMINADAVVNRLSRRLLEDKTLAEQRVSVGAVETTLRLRERKIAAPETTGRSNLSRAQITTRVRTLRGARNVNARGERPSRRSIIDEAESMLELPPTLVQTGGETTVQKVSRRTLRAITEEVNRLDRGE